MRRRNPVWYTGRKDDLGLRVHPWTAFDGQVIDSPIWLTPDESFAKANAGHHGFIYTVEFEPKRAFPDRPLLDWAKEGGTFLVATPFGRSVQKAIETGEIFGDPVEDGWELLTEIDRGDYSTMETKGLIDWVLARGYDSMIVTGDGPVNLAVFDPAPIRVLSIKPATPGHDPVNCVGCRKVAKRNPTYYHGTRTEHMDSIMKKGLSYPFLSSEESQARCWGRNYSTDGGRDVRVLEVEIDDEDRVVPDFNLMDEEDRQQALGIEPGEYFDVRSELLGGEDDLIAAGKRFGSNSVDDRECGGEASIYLGTVPPKNLREVGREVEEDQFEENPLPEDVYREHWERTGDVGHGLRYVAELEKGGFSGKLWQFSHAADVYERLAQIYEAAGNWRMLEVVRQRLEEIAPDLNAQFVRCGLCATWFYVGSQATARRRARTLSNHTAICAERTPAERVFYKRERKWPQNREFWRSGEGART